MTMDNVNILLISSAFEVLSGSKAFTIRSLFLSQTQNPTNPWRRGDTGLPHTASRTNAILIIQHAIH